MEAEQGDRMEEIKDKIVDWLEQKRSSASADGFVIGLSGGVDSSTVAALCKRTTDNVLGIIMPCHSDPQDIEHAEMVAEAFDIKTETVDLSKMYDSLIAVLPEGSRLAKANIKPRLRMLTLYYFANLHNHLVAGTGNKSEEMVGYATKYGDGGVDILPIGDLYKHEVRELARSLGVPSEIIDKPPSAGLWEGQTDEGEMGITYAELDRILDRIEAGNAAGEDPELVKKVERMIETSAHKRVAPETCKLK